MSSSAEVNTEGSEELAQDLVQTYFHWSAICSERNNTPQLDIVARLLHDFFLDSAAAGERAVAALREASTKLRKLSTSTVEPDSLGQHVPSTPATVAWQAS
jgi:hypothetical protein